MSAGPEMEMPNASGPGNVNAKCANVRRSGPMLSVSLWESLKNRTLILV